MPAVRVLILRAPGANCDVETAYAFSRVGADADRVHVNRLRDDPKLLRRYQVLCLPGGFAYGDDVAAGKILAVNLRSFLSDEISRFRDDGKLILGICNGFQVLLKAGILPAGTAHWPPPAFPTATLTWNNNGKYTALWVHLRRASPHSVFLRGIESLELPVAHAEGRIVPRDASVLDDWHRQGQIALRYTYADRDGGEEICPYPVNPNGSAANIAGLCDPTGRVLGLMPHPERFIHATQHPQWTRRKLRGDGAGLQVFRNAVEYFG